MGQYKNINGRRYFKSLASMTRAKAQRIAKERRKRGVLARASPDPDHPGYYGVYTCRRK